MIGNKKINTFDLSLTVPIGEIEFGLDFKINGKDYHINKIKNQNFNEPKEKSGKSFIMYSPFVEFEEKQQFRNDVEFTDIDITGAEFTVIGEKILEIDILNKNSVIIISENDKPAIVGYYYRKNNKTICMFNSYHTEFLEEK